MVELILRYFKQLNNSRFEIMEQYEVAWKGRNIIQEKVKEGESDLKLLINEIKKGKKEGDEAISNFREKYLPKNAIRLNEYVDVEALLDKASNIYSNEFKNLNDDQCVQYCVKVIGFIQSLLTPETAKKLCRDRLDYIEGFKRFIFFKQLDSVYQFYRNSSSCVEGLGYESYVTMNGEEMIEILSGPNFFSSWTTYYNNKLRNLNSVMLHAFDSEKITTYDWA